MIFARIALVFVGSISVGAQSFDTRERAQSANATGDRVETATVATGELGRHLVEIAQRAEAAGFSGAVLAARDGAVVAAVGVGHSDLRDVEPNTPATLFEIASVTKSFTAAAVMRLVQEEKLGLDDSIAEHLPKVPKDCRAITVRHLLQHTSGIPGSNSEGSGNKIESVLPQFLKGGPRHRPGTHFEYWNQGYALLSEIIARTSGMDCVDYCREALFVPAGMSASCFTGDDPPPNSVVAVGRSVLGEPRSALEHPYGSYGFQYRGMGGMVTSVWDLWRWDRALTGEAVLSKTSKKALFDPGLEDYALGWHVRKDDSRTVQSHSGRVRGFACDVRRYPGEDACLFVLCNRDDMNPTNLTDFLERALLDEEVKSALPPRALTEEWAEALAGTWEDEKGRVIEIETQGVVTRVAIHWGKNGPVTRATLGLNDEDELVLFEWESSTPLLTDFDPKKGGKKAKRLSLLDSEYRRSR